MKPSTRRGALIVLLVGFLVLQGYASGVAGNPGWIQKYGVIGAFIAYIELSLADPIMLAGLIDFLTLGLLAATLMISQMPAAHRWRLSTWVWLIVFVIYPGLGAILYFLWLNPAHSLVTGEKT